MSQDLFHQMLNNIDQSSKQQLTPKSCDSTSSSNSEQQSFYFSSNNSNNQLKRPGNLELNNKHAAAMSFNHGNSSGESAKKSNE